MAIDQTGTMVNLAKQWKMDQAQGPENATVPRATLLLILDALIDLGAPAVPVMQEGFSRTVAGMIADRSPKE